MKFGKVLTASTALGLLFFALTAQAAAVARTCTVSGLMHDTNRVKFTCAEGGSYYGSTAACGTATASLENVRTWASLGQSALLAGKKVILTTETTASNCIYSVELLK